MEGKKRRKIGGCLTALLLALSLAGAACGDNRASAIQLKKTRGYVDVMDEEGEMLDAAQDMRLYSGYGLSTGRKSYAWLNLDNVRLAKLDASSEIEIEKSGKDLEIFVNAGKLYFNIKEPLAEDETLNIRTSNMSVGIRGTCGWVEADDERSMRVYVLEGTVECAAEVRRGQSRTVNVSGGQMAELTVPEEGDAEIKVEEFTEEEVLPFVLEEVGQDEELRKKILEDSGLDLPAGGNGPETSVSQAVGEIGRLSEEYGLDDILRERTSGEFDPADLLAPDLAGVQDNADMVRKYQDMLIGGILGQEGFEGEVPWWIRNFVDTFASSGTGELADYMQIRMGSGINCYKPNIYLYGREGSSFTLSFAEPEILVKTLPAYSDRWEVTLREGGMLAVDGREGYPYLFYESTTIPGIFQTQEGFLVKAENRAARFEEILKEYGLNSRETADFIEFWDEMLDRDADYVMYPQTTALVDRAMPLEIQGDSIDNYFRLWFGFWKVEGEKMPEFSSPKITAASHDRNALVEWGGMILP